MDFNGNVIKRFSSHSATVNDISIDVAEEYVASASMDGKISISFLRQFINYYKFKKILILFVTIGRVVIHGMCSDSKQVFNYRRPLKCVALDPDFSRKATFQFVSGGLAGQLVLNEKGINYFELVHQIFYQFMLTYPSVIGWFGQKQDRVLQHSGEGPIYAARWRGNLIAYANEEVTT